MTTTTMHRATNSNDRAAILTLIHSRDWAVAPAMAVVSRQLTISLGDDFAFSDGLVCVRGARPEGDGPALIWMRETVCFERCAGGWRVVREDTSAPLRVASGARRERMAGSKLRVGWTAGYSSVPPRSEGTV